MMLLDRAALLRFIRTSPFISLLVSRLRRYFWAVGSLWYRGRFLLNSYVPLNVKLIGARRIMIGRNVVIGSGSWLNVNDRFGDGYALWIGDNSFVGQNNFFTVGSVTKIGPYCLTARDCSFVDSSHIYSDPMTPYSSSGTSKSLGMHVGANCFFGYGATVLGSVSIGHGSVIGARAVVTCDVPPFSVVVGNPARVIRRFCFERNEWVRWPADYCVEGPAEAEYIVLLNEGKKSPIHHISAAVSVFGDMP